VRNFGDTQTATQALFNFSEGFVGWKPLFSGGVQIGNWTSAGGFFDVNAADVMADICRGAASLNDNLTAAQQDPNSWTTVDDWWNPISVNDYCMQKAIVPTWFTQDQVNQYAPASGGGYARPGGASSSLILPLAIGGGLVALSVLLTIVRR
jgi:hypothetical protein